MLLAVTSHVTHKNVNSSLYKWLTRQTTLTAAAGGRSNTLMIGYLVRHVTAIVRGKQVPDCYCLSTLIFAIINCMFTVTIYSRVVVCCELVYLFTVIYI